MKTLNAVLILLIFILVYCPSECFEISNCCLTEGGGGDRVKETTRTSVYPNAYPIFKKKSGRRLKYIKGILRATLFLWLSISMFIFFYRRPTISRWLLREFSKLMIWSTVSHMTISLYSYKEVHVSQYDTDFKTFLLKYISKTLKSSSAVYGKK